MASVQELLAAAQAQKSPFTSLLEGAAQGFGQAQNEGLSRAKQLIELEDERQARERNKAMHETLLKKIAGGAEQATKDKFNKVTPPPTPSLPGPRLDKITLNPKGYLTPSFEVDTPKPSQDFTYQDNKGKNRIGVFNPITQERIMSEKDPLAPVTNSQSGGALGNDLRKEFIGLPEVKEYNVVATSVKSMDKLLGAAMAGDVKNKVALDQALITMYNKLTDPQSVVRESEYGRTPENLPVVNRIYGALAKIKQGGAGLTNEDRQALVVGAKIIANVRGKAFSERRQKYNELAGQVGADPNIVTGTIDSFQPFDLGNDKIIAGFKVKRRN